MTWGEFKKAVDALGVRDDEELNFIDWSGGSPEIFNEEAREKNGVAIT